MSGKEAWTVGATHLPLGDLPRAFTSAGLAIARMVELGTASLSDTGNAELPSQAGWG
jgi:hypothetical protein